MGRIKDLPISLRPREKAYRLGIDKLSDYELLSILIGSGCQDHSASDIAYKMISDARGLNSLITRPYTDLLNYKGIGKNKAIKIIATFEIAKRFQISKSNYDHEVIDTIKIFKKLSYELMNSPQEFMYLFILDKRKRLIHEVNLYKGNERAVPYSVDQIIREVMIHRGSFFYIAHNHPSGQVAPSDEDVFFTTEIISAIRNMNFQMIDHLIISTDRFYSFMTQKTTKIEEYDINQHMC